MKNDAETISIVLPKSIISKLRDVASRRELDISDYIRIALKAMSRKSRYFAMGDLLTFGKYENEVLNTIIQTDPTYIVWCIRNIEGFLISEEAEELLLEVLHRDGIEVGEDLYRKSTLEN